MENASKALIIAGAILLSILIITLGLSVYNNAKSATGNADLTGQEINAHNSQFTAYEGRQKGSQVKALMTTIKSNNKQYADRQVKVYYSNTTSAEKNWETDNVDIYADSGDINAESGSGETATSSRYPADIKNGTTYYVTFHEGNNGVINKCEVHVYSQDD